MLNHRKIAEMKPHLKAEIETDVVRERIVYANKCECLMCI